MGVGLGCVGLIIFRGIIMLEYVWLVVLLVLTRSES